jgi:hypothetical protein
MDKLDVALLKFRDETIFGCVSCAKIVTIDKLRSFTQHAH